MKKTFLIILVVCINTLAVAQVAGNLNYQNAFRYAESNIELELPENSNQTTVVKGMANIKADNYVATFNVTQVGKTAAEVNQLIEVRITEGLKALKATAGLEIFVDMISFVPVYEYEVEKKLFSKKTYNEVPKGFELKKNIHIKYKDASALNEIITTLSNVEIYDLVKVEYYSDKIEATKLELQNKAKLLVQEKLKHYKQIIGAKIDSTEKQLIDGFRILYPVEMYKSYQAYSSAELSLKKSANINAAEKSTTQYYQPIINKEFDFVINPTIVEPAIQVLYEIKIELSRTKDRKTNPKEYYIITPNGELKKIEPNN
jgi:uncharacterized protein YggE